MWLKILCSGRKNNSAPVPIQNGVRCLTTKLTLSFALINTNIATAKKCCWHFFVARKKERQWDLMNDTNARNSFFVCTSIATKWGRCTGKMYDADLIARTRTCTYTHICMLLLRSNFFTNPCLFCCFVGHVYHTVKCIQFNRRFSSEQKTAQHFVLFTEMIKLNWIGDMMEWLESRR